MAFAKARKSADFEVDEAGIDRLRMIVNCIKHAGRKNLYDAAPDLFDQDLINADVDAAFAAVRSSGPKSPGANEAIQELEL
ncbi:hypothetical protein ATU3C_25165 [Agrobacterium genomosp. 3 str. RTP8]|uniref:hypothetical protein n=1 Tax=Agrobacterium tomkonis TaxID=1183410 RepID=UPI001CDA2930|nr:hypothetical protein [Agrobacterium tomkonis RTP8]